MVNQALRKKIAYLAEKEREGEKKKENTRDGSDKYCKLPSGIKLKNNWLLAKVSN